MFKKTQCMLGVDVKIWAKDFLYWVIEDQTHFGMPRGYFKVTQLHTDFQDVRISGAR